VPEESNISACQEHYSLSRKDATEFVENKIQGRPKTFEY
jgi:hypothetical protein